VLKLDATTALSKVIRVDFTPFGFYIRIHLAEVVELVDALASGASGRKLVGVRVPPSAHKKERRVC
jgi:hypothetical protein